MAWCTTVAELEFARPAMDPVRWQQVKNLYEAASARPIRERAAFLAVAQASAWRDACQ